MSLEILATICFTCAVLHTFATKYFRDLSHQHAPGSAAGNLLHVLGEVEAVFGLWAATYIICLSVVHGFAASVTYMESLSFTEPAFVFVVMVVCASRPIMNLASFLLQTLARVIPLARPVAFYVVLMTVGPWLGSLITEPAAMTVIALILLQRYFIASVSSSFKYATLGLLFVNVSIGGTLTSFAAPPVLMVAAKWQWDAAYMLEHFGYKAIAACLLSTAAVVLLFYKELLKVPVSPRAHEPIPKWIEGLHLLMLALIVLCAHHSIMFIALFLFFLGLTIITERYQDSLKFKESVLVAFFLGGIVVLGPPQRWWLEPVLTSLSALPLYLGAMGLTALTDNAALTFLGSQVPDLAESARYALVAGAVVGGGLTVIANAPNPAGYGILSPAFGEEGIHPFKLLVSALGPTLIAALCFWLL